MKRLRILILAASPAFGQNDARKVPAAGGLPLGVAADSEWEETCVDLEPGSRIRFVPDGMSEATNAKGELFGIERTCAISSKALCEIAEASQTWGQEDDIMIVTVAYA